MHRLLCLLLAAASPLTWGGQVKIAAASNFLAPLKELTALYESASGDRVVISAGSTGKLYAQIRNGAPFDLFLAADGERPRQLEAQGIAVKDSRFTYATGRLVLWSARPGFAGRGEAVLKTGEFEHLAMANPRLAPYGIAAKQAMQALELWEVLQPRLVYGENIGQAYQFVASGAAGLGFVALSQVRGREQAGSYWQVPDTLYEPVEQQAVLLNDTPAARAFYEYLRSAPARRLIQRYGYKAP